MSTSVTGSSQMGTAERPWLAHYQEGVPAELEIPAITVDQLLRDAARRFPTRDALIFFGARTTFAELDRAVDRFAGILHGLGLQPGDRVSLHLPTSPAFVIAFFGTLRAGCLAVPISPLLVERELRIVLRETAPRLSIVLDLLVPRLRAVRDDLGEVLQPPGSGSDLIVTGIQDSLPIPIRWLYPLKARRDGRWRPAAHSAATPNLFRLLASSQAGPVESGAKPGDPAILQPTGGTTGVPKAAVLTHRNLVANVHQVAAWFPGGTAGQDTVLCALPYFHIYGMTVAMNYSILRGSTQILHPRFEARPVFKSIAKYRPRLFPGAPLFYATLMDDPNVGRFDLSSIEACISGAAGLPRHVQERFEAATGGRVSEGYGLTEASPVTHCNPIHGLRKPGTIGLPFPSTDAGVVDLEEGTRTLPPGEAGELRIRGPQVMAGYWQRPEETAAAIRDGWLYTADVATMDEDGYFRIVDRRKDLIIVGGVNVYPREVEEVLLAHPAVAEAVVIAEPHPQKGEVPFAYVVLEPDVTATIEELHAHCRTNLASFKRPATIEIRLELPKTMNGKVLRRALIEERQAQAQPVTRS
jgi:long-chain acyl-CoA synthetase